MKPCIDSKLCLQNMIYWAALKNQSPKHEFHLAACKINCAITFNLSKALDEAYIITTLYNNEAFWCQFVSHSENKRNINEWNVLSSSSLLLWLLSHSMSNGITKKKKKKKSLMTQKLQLQRISFHIEHYSNVKKVRWVQAAYVQKWIKLLNWWNETKCMTLQKRE